MMQYVLYEVKSAKAGLFEEINYINNYIDIMRLRFNESIECETDITGDIEDVEVPPLLFLSFIENCFKHGLKDNDEVKIKMSFEIISKDYLEFILINSFNPESNVTNKDGIGIVNTKRRLSLLFGSDYILETSIKNDTFNLFLKIPIR
jgi:LytS/YehU family sensor histidine kinase